jgi:LuxR family maltose regulon positive regulatory protein
VVARRELFELLSGAAGVTVLSAPAGSGKTVLLRSWVEGTGLRDRVAWVSVEPEELDAQSFWLVAVRELRSAIGADAFLEKLEPTPTFQGDECVERLISQLATLEQVVVLVIDDLHELRAPDALRQLEVLLSRRPPLLRIVLASRHDPRLGLHRLRLVGELTEIRAADLRFTLEEARELLAGAGVALSEKSLARLHQRTEGWAAGLRLAALALEGHPAPERFVAEFTGSERTVAEYLFAEVLERQPEGVRRLLLRTSVLERVNGALADLLTGGAGSQRTLQDLEEQNAFVVSLDAGRSWFRYHRLFADLLRLELARTEPRAVRDLHRTAAEWYALHGEVVDAVRHFQAAEDWAAAGRLLAEQSFALWLAGLGATVHGLLSGIPAAVVSGDPELAGVFARSHVWAGSASEAAANIALAERGAAAVPDERMPAFELTLGLTRLMLARRRGDLPGAVAEAQRLLAAEALVTGLGDAVRAVTLANLGIVELWSARLGEGERDLEQALDLARLGGWSWVEVQCLAHLALSAASRWRPEARGRALEAIAIAEAHGWAADDVVGTALVVLAASDILHGRFADAEQWLSRADKVVRPDLEPATALLLYMARGMTQTARGRYEEAAAAYRAAAQVEVHFAGPHMLVPRVGHPLAETQARLGDTAAARATLAELSEDERASGPACCALATAFLVDGDPQAAADVLAPVLDGSVPPVLLWLLVEACLLDAVARDLLGQAQAAQAGVERALELAEPDGLAWPFVVTPVRDLLERHPRHRTAHGALLRDVLDVLAGKQAPTPRGEPPMLRENLTEGELRVLRYLPSNLSAPEIGRELYLSVHTVKTHMWRIYAKLGAHRRTEAVERARELGLLAPSLRLR